MSTSHPPLAVAGRGLALVLARLRFLLLIGGVLALVAYWPTLQHFWEHLTRPTPYPVSVSSDTEFWCPMCPGVVSDWPSKCPVCHMTLVRRLKGEVTPLPDGVVARVQLSPYRIMLAGVHTTAVDYRPLDDEIIAGGKLESASTLIATAFADDAVLLAEGMSAEVSVDELPGEKFTGHLESTSAAGREVKLRVAVTDPRGRLRPGHYAEAHFSVAASRQQAVRDTAVERWRDQTAVEMLVAGTKRPAALGALFEAAVQRAMIERGLMITIPESAVIDTGSRQVAFIESMPGMYDAVEVRLGRRCRDQYPVLSGLSPGQRVVTAGSVLLDAETRLNPSLAAAYFGAGSRGSKPAAPPPPGSLSTEDQLLAQKQKICPVTGESLDSMGGPIRVLVNGKPVFICCEGCRKPLLKEPAKYLARIAK
jgi:hypothetical protein